jgi:hypothetical protein
MRSYAKSVRVSGVLAKTSYVRSLLTAMSPDERRSRLKTWALKPHLGRRIVRFVIPQAGLRTRRLKSTRRRGGLPRHYVTVTSWQDARQRNVDETKRILGAAGVEFVEIDDTSPFRSQLGVASTDKSKVIEAFRSHGDHGTVLSGEPWTTSVRMVKGNPSVFDRLQAARMELCPSLVLHQCARAGSASRVHGIETGTVISFWAPGTDGDRSPMLYGSADNKWTRVAPAAHGQSNPQSALPGGLHGRRHILDVAFPVDLVCFWVDGSDPLWNERKRVRLGGTKNGALDAAISREANESRLYRNRDELRYALRSIQMYAPFVRHVYLITDRQTPEWLDQCAPGLTIVDHSEIFPPEALPVFNSNAIDTRVHYIDGLSEHFLVSNDDIMFFGPVIASDFFNSSGAARVFLSGTRIPLGDNADGEPAVDSAAKNNRRLLEKHYGVTITQKFKHIMSAQRRSVRMQVEDTFRDAVEATTRHPFRSIDDIAFSHLCAYNGLLTGESTLGTLPYDYVSLGDPRLGERLDALRRRPQDVRVLCLNDGDTSTVHDDHGRPIGEIVVDQADRDAKIGAFLETMFPTPSTWERKEPRVPSDRQATPNENEER